MLPMKILMMLLLGFFIEKNVLLVIVYGTYVPYPSLDSSV